MLGGFMIKEKYNKYKSIYKKYLILMKVGNFYICLNEDAIVLSNIFKFKITESKNFIKCGFPISSLIKVINRLNDIKINYLIVDNDITEKEKYTTNNYDKYNTSNNYILLNRIDRIYSILKINVNNSNINDIINNIENIVCKISY